MLRSREPTKERKKTGISLFFLKGKDIKRLRTPPRQTLCLVSNRKKPHAFSAYIFISIVVREKACKKKERKNQLLATFVKLSQSSFCDEGLIKEKERVGERRTIMYISSSPFFLYSVSQRHLLRLRIVHRIAVSGGSVMCRWV